MNYDVDYFIKKFEDVPGYRWWMGDYHNENKTRFCAAGLCGGTAGAGCMTYEFYALSDLFVNYFGFDGRVSNINDGIHHAYQQPTPKQRVLAALYDIKARQQPKDEPKERIIYVTVDEKVRDLQKHLQEN
jgi:hypothetical protein